ncbi:MAG: winged helix-turn-helix domain-containing protein, partial [Myxococcota bacterium]
MISCKLLIAGALVDPARRSILREGRETTISEREATVLGYLADRMGQVVTREQLLHDVWGQVVTQTRAVDNLVTRLRRKLGDSATRPTSLFTVRGEGYRLRAEIVEPDTPRPSLDIGPIDRALLGPGRTVEVVGHDASAAVLSWAAQRQQAWRAIVEVPRLDLHRCDAIIERVAQAVGCPPGEASVGEALAGLGSVVVVVPSTEGAALTLRRLLSGWRERAPNCRWVIGTTRALGLSATVQLGSTSDAALADSDTPRPLPAVPLVGRRPSLLELEEAWRNGRRVFAVIGPPGSGKSAVLGAFEVSVRGARSRWCAVDQLQIGTSLDVAMASTLGVNLSHDGIEDRARLCRALSAMHEPWIVLDGAEGRLDDVEDLVLDLLLAVPQLRVGLTSRVAPRHLGETRAMLGPLDDASSVELLERGRPGEAWTHEDLVRVARLLDGLPLALELVAPRLSSLPPSALLPTIAASLGLVRDASHRSLRAVLSQAWMHLSASDQDVLASLAVLEGPFDVDTAAAATGSTRGRVTDALARLVDASMVGQRDAVGRFELLRTTRLFARTQLGERAPAVIERTARYLAEVARAAAEQADGRGIVEALRVLDDYRPHLEWVLRESRSAGPRAAVGLGLACFHRFRGSTRSRRELLVSAFADVPDDDPELRALVALQLAGDASARRDAGALSGWAERAHVAARRADEPALACLAASRRASAAALSDHPWAEAWFSDALAQAGDEPGLRAEVLAEWSSLARDEDLATSWEAWDLARKAGAWACFCKCGVALGFRLRHAGQRVEAERVFRATLQRVQQVEWVLFSAGLNYLLGDLAMASGNLSEAKGHLHEAVQLGARHGSDGLVALSWTNLAAVELA